MEPNKVNKIKIVKEILKDEIEGNVKGAIDKSHKDYSMTWVYQTRKGDIFPSETIDSGEDIEDIYKIKGRKYEIMNMTESDDVVMVEMIESYPDPETGDVYRTPLVIVLEFEGDKIKTGRHYCDPRLSFMHLTKEQTDKAFKNPDPKEVIE